MIAERLFKKRPLLTLLGCLGGRVVRADFGTAETPQQLWQISHVANTGLVESIQQAVKLSAATLGQLVFFLSDEIWAQSLSLPRKQVAGLAPDELARSLAFEIEPFSNIPTTEGQVAFVNRAAQDGQLSFWIQEITQGELRALQAAVQAAGSRLAGVSHPAGLPQAFAEYPLANSGSPRDQEQDMSPWLCQWAAALRADAAGLPLLRPAAVPKSARHYVLMAAALEAGVLLVCGAHAAWITQQRTHLREQSIAYAEEATRINQIIQQNKAAQASLDILHQTQAGWERMRRMCELQRAAWPRMLHALAKVRPDDVVVQGISATDNHAVQVKGLSLRAGSSDDLANSLALALRDTGWLVEPRGHQAQKLFDNGGPWSFEIRLVPAWAASAAATAATATPEWWAP